MKEALDALERGPMTEDELAWIKGHGDLVHADASRASPLRPKFWRAKSAE
jgi:hypothetical protein